MNRESNAATPASAAMNSAKARLEYQLGARKINRESEARSPCVAVITTGSPW